MKPFLPVVSLVLASVLAAQGPLSGRDWFVRAPAASGAAPGGDGSRAAPFADPWQALDKCEAGDRIHVAAGRYFGKFGTGCWQVPFDRVQLLGGYDAEFAARDPWARPTLLCWDPGSKNWPKDERLWTTSRDVVVDGITIDMQDQNEYIDERKSCRTTKPSPTAMRFTQPATVRNCVIVNPGFHALDCVAGSLIENNLVVNALDWGIVVTGAVTGVAKATAIVRNNTVLFSWDLKKPGAGGYGGAAVALRGPATVQDNILGFCDNAALYSVTAPEHLRILGNVFWKNRYANLTAETGAQRAVVSDRSMELFEEVGLKEQAGNEVKDPELALDPDWLAATGKRAQKPDEAARGEAPQGIAPALSLEKALALLAPKAAGLKAGARVQALAAPAFADAPAVRAAKTYERRELKTWNRDPAAVEGMAVEMLVAIGGVANVSGMPSSYQKDGIAGVFLWDVDGSGERVTGFYAKGTGIERTCTDVAGEYRGSGKPEKLFVVRGTAHAAKTVPKGALHIESLERFVPPTAAAKRPLGRDWFVRAGSAGGDGTREKPFRDPYQALERCEAGDTIHVAGGEYFGKLKAGRWKIGMPFVALLGGYDAQFATRAPWQHATRLYCPPEFQGRRGGYTLEGEGDHTGAIVDGFVFDKRHDNVYGKDGELDVGHSDKTEHLWLARPDCVVRNCAFLNGACGAVRAASGQTFENNVFVNHVTQTVCVEKGHTTVPFVLRSNTVLFAWARRPGGGLGENGSLLRLCGTVRAVVEDNVFAYADNDAIRLETDPREVALVGNAFARNLWSHVQQMQGWHAFDDRNFAELAGLGLLKCERNRLEVPSLALDAAWFQKHQQTRGPDQVAKKEPAVAEAKVERNPFDDAPPARQPSPAGTAFAPAYEVAAALALFAQDGDVGARVRTLEVAFTGVVRVEEKHEYAPTTWEVARSADAWEKLAERRVRLEVAVKCADNQFLLPGVDAEQYACYLVGGPEGTDSGLPLRCYVKKGTQAQRVFDQAKGYGPGKPLELHVLEGVAKGKRQMLVERAEKSS